MEKAAFLTILVSVNILRHGQWVIRAAVITLAGMTCACFAPDGPKVVTSPDPSLKIPAIKTSAEKKDFSAVKQLIKDLESDDPAVRFYSISALERLTGQTFGYQYFVEDEKRTPAVEKWKAWHQGWEAGQREASKK
jgi:hypothetical protein